MITSATSVFAEYNKEILFNGIPWGTKYSEVIKMLKEKFGDDLEFSEKRSSISEDEYKHRKNYSVFNYDGNWTTKFSVRSDETVSVANNNAYIILTFVYPNNGKTLLTDDINNAIFVGARYDFQVYSSSYTFYVSPDTIIDDLQIMLGNVYGEFDKIDHDEKTASRYSKGGYYDVKDYIYGKNGTKLLFDAWEYMSYILGDGIRIKYAGVTIKYGGGKIADKALEEATKIVDEENKRANEEYKKRKALEEEQKKKQKEEALKNTDGL